MSWALTNSVAVALAVVAEELQTSIRIVTTLLFNGRLDSLGGADRREVVGVAGVAVDEPVSIAGVHESPISWDHPYPITDSTQAGVEAETMLARATKAIARVDLNNMMRRNKSQY